MDKEVSIVLSPEKRNYRKVAQEWYGLTDEQMVGMDVHHNPARHEGGRNIPEHLYVYHNTLHSAVHGGDFVLWSRKGPEKTNAVKDKDGKSINAAKGGNIGGPSSFLSGKGIHDPSYRASERFRSMRTRVGERMKNEKKGIFNPEFRAKQIERRSRQLVFHFPNGTFLLFPSRMEAIRQTKISSSTLIRALKKGNAIKCGPFKGVKIKEGATG